MRKRYLNLEVSNETRICSFAADVRIAVSPAESEDKSSCGLHKRLLDIPCGVLQGRQNRRRQKGL
jgi:hypothetical protein